MAEFLCLTRFQFFYSLYVYPRKRKTPSLTAGHASD